MSIFTHTSKKKAAIKKGGYITIKKAGNIPAFTKDLVFNYFEALLPPKVKLYPTRTPTNEVLEPSLLAPW